jgi:signal transduction histidine kinase
LAAPTTPISIAADPVRQPTLFRRGYAFTDYRFVFARWVRYLGVGYVAVTVPLCTVLLSPVQGESNYYAAIMVVRCVYWAPGLVAALVAGRRGAPGHRLIWRWWAVGFGLGTLWSAARLPLGDRDWAVFRQGAVPSSAVVVVLLIVTNTMLMRSRSGQRTFLIDVVDLVMATVAILVPAALLFGRQIVDSPSAWYSVSAALWLVGAGYGTLVASLVAPRLLRSDRNTARFGVLLGSAAMIDGLAQVIQGTHNFELAPAPFIATHALANGLIALFFLWSRRRSSSGLERFPLRDQVRGGSAITVLILASVPALAWEMWRGRDDDVVVAIAIATGSLLLILSSVRHLLSARETTRLCRKVQRAADERGEILAGVMSHADADRHRVAAHLHRQAASLYTAMSEFTRSPDASVDATWTATGLAAQQLRESLGRQSDELRRIAIAIKPMRGLDEMRSTPPLAAPVRAYLERLYGDGPRPEIEVNVDPELALDWTSETILLRIVQEAIHNVWRHARATSVRVCITAEDELLELEVADDGAGFDPAVSGRGIASMWAMAKFIGGDLSVASAPGKGTVVRATSAFAPLPHLSQARLHLVDT